MLHFSYIPSTVVKSTMNSPALAKALPASMSGMAADLRELGLREANSFVFVRIDGGVCWTIEKDRTRVDNSMA
jgi:hypothetical protein